MIKSNLFRNILSLILLSFLFSFSNNKGENKESGDDFYLVVLGIAQDGGYPHAGCMKECCKLVYSGKEPRRNVVSLGIVDKKNNKVWMFEATPDFTSQWHQLQTTEGIASKNYPDGIFVTHGHIGHYAGLMYLGREAMGTKQAPVYVMPRMASYLTKNGPWSQLVDLNNITINTLKADSSINLPGDIKVTPFLVPHRDEFSETVGYKIESANKKIIFIPDIDKWDKWDRSIVEEVKKADMAFVDATFFKDGELPGRSMKEVRHPFVEETMGLFASSPASEKKKIFFIHFNHTNPVLWDKKAQKEVKAAGFNFATEGMKVDL